MSLSSLIVQREVATMRQVEEALARQVIYGGDLVTNLLEVAQVDESILVELLAESMRLAAAPSGELPDTSDRVKALLPREVAIERTAVPLEVNGDGRLVLAVAEPLSRDVVDQLRFALGMGIEQRAAPAVRVQQAVARAYGVPLERRMLRLLARLAGGMPAAGSSLPPLGVAPAFSEPPQSPSSPPSHRTLTGYPAASAGAVVGRLAPKLPTRRTTSTSFPAVRPPQEVISAAARPAAPARTSAPAPVRSSAPAPARTSAPAPAPAPVRSSAPASSAENAGLLQRDRVPGPRAGRRRRGPITVDVAKQEAEEAEDRDALLDLFFDFSQQFFDYSALFLVHGDIAEGRDAFGAGATRERVLGIGVPLDLPSMMSTARETRLPLVAHAPPDSLDAVLLADLHRGRDSETVMVPLVVRTRAVAILIGDCGDAGIERATVQQVTAFSGVVGKAFERIIVRRKLSGFIAGAVESAAGRVPSSKVAPKTSSNVSESAPPPDSPPPVSPPPPFVPPAPAPSNATKRAARSNAPPPPPAANVAAVRKISGAPIPREEPDTPKDAPSFDRSTPPESLASPELEVVAIDIHGTDDAAVASSLLDELGWDDAEIAANQLPSSAAVSVPPHHPPAPVTASVELPSVIVDDLERDLVSMVDRLAAGEVDDFAEAELLRQGVKAMRALMSRFPGPIVFSRLRIATSPNPPKASECGPVLRLVARERRVALPFVLERLASPDAEVRGWATHLLAELPYVEGIAPLVARLHDADASTRASAAHALIAIARSSPQPVREALVALARGTATEHRTVALGTMAALRDASFVPEFVRALGDGDDRVVASAHHALVQVTRQDLGTDARPWLRWWDQNSGKHRIEWLIDALAHDVAEIRKSAGEELRALTKEYFGYAGDLPPRDRDRAQQRYRDWWTMEGRGRFRQS